MRNFAHLLHCLHEMPPIQPVSVRCHKLAEARPPRDTNQAKDPACHLPIIAGSLDGGGAHQKREMLHAWLQAFLRQGSQ